MLKILQTELSSWPKSHTGPESRQDSPLSPAKEHLAKNSLFFSSFVFGHSGTRRLWQCLCAIRKHWEAFSAGFMELDA